MTDLQVPTVQTKALTAGAAQEGDAIIVRFQGHADIRVTEGVGALVRAVHAQALERRVAKVVVDLRQLEFMNSSCFKAFCTWLQELQEVEPDRQYKVRLLSSPEHHWQARSLAALACFAADLVQVEG